MFLMAAYFVGRYKKLHRLSKKQYALPREFDQAEPFWNLL